MTPDEILNSLYSTIDLWERELDRYTLQELTIQPSEGSWSLGQVYTHLLGNVLGYNFPEIESCLTSDKHIQGEKTEEAKEIFERNGFPDIQMKTPPSDEAPDQPESVEQLKSGMREVRETIPVLAAKITTSKYRGKTKHPGLHYFDAWEWMQFIDIHFRHHLRQKKRIDQYLAMVKKDSN